MLQNALRIARVTVVLAVLGVVGLTNAQPETFMPGVDLGLQAVGTQVTEIGITGYSPYDDINVTVDWAYADGHRIAFGWTIEHDWHLSYDTPVPTLTGENGQSFPLASPEYNRGGTAGGSLGRTYYIYINSFDASGITGEPEMLKLTAGFTFEALPERAATTAVVSKPFSTSIAFEVPFIPAQEIDGEISAEANGLTLTLSDLSYTPSGSIATLCYPLTENSEPLTPYVPRPTYIDLLAYFTPDATSREDGLICDKLVTFIAADDETGILTLTIDRLQSETIVTEENVARLQELVSEAGLPLEVMTETSADGALSTFLNPTGEIEDRDAIMLLFEALETQAMRETVEGPWIFEIDLNE